MTSTTAFENHFTIAQLADRWKLGRETIRKLVCRDPGVLKTFGSKGERITYRIPESAALRIYRQLQAGRAIAA